MVRFLAVAATVALLLAACGDSEPWQAAAAEHARDLDLLEDVEVIRMTREEFSLRAEQNANGLSQDYIDYYSNTYGRLGYFDSSVDLRMVLAGSSSDWVGATYSPGSKLITLVGDAPDHTFVHEYVHAIQDQHFNLTTYDRPQTSDSFLARRAVVEGDASLAQYRFIGLDDGNVELDQLRWADSLQARRQFSSDTLSEAIYPVVFLDYVSFVYTYGLEYVAENLIGVTFEDPESILAPPHDWRRQDRLFLEQPPDSTQQILRREFVASASDPVVEVGLSAVPEELASRLAAVDWDTLGEWYIYLLFYPQDLAGELDARALAAAWDGDKVLFVRDRESNAHAALWTSEWDDAASATAIGDALWALHGRNPVKGSPAHLARADDGELVWIERRGTRLVVAKNLPLDVASTLIERAFADSAELRPRRHPSLPAVLQRLRRGD